MIRNNKTLFLLMTSLGVITVIAFALTQSTSPEEASMRVETGEIEDAAANPPVSPSVQSSVTQTQNREVVTEKHARQMRFREAKQQIGNHKERAWYLMRNPTLSDSFFLSEAGEELQKVCAQKPPRNLTRYQHFYLKNMMQRMRPQLYAKLCGDRG